MSPGEYFLGQILLLPRPTSSNLNEHPRPSQHLRRLSNAYSYQVYVHQHHPFKVFLGTPDFQTRGIPSQVFNVTRLSWGVRLSYFHSSSWVLRHRCQTTVGGSSGRNRKKRSCRIVRMLVVWTATMRMKTTKTKTTMPRTREV